MVNRLSKLRNLRSLKQHQNFNKATAGIGILLFGIVGTIVLIRSHAATPFISTEPEQGTIAGNACGVVDNSASNGNAVKFGAPCSGGGALNLPRITWEGGPSYWNKFPKAVSAGWTNPNFFPIGIWYESACNIQGLRDLDINLMVGVNHDITDINCFSGSQSSGMSFIIQDEWTQSQISPNGNQVAGWLVSDEVDMNSTNPIAQQQTDVNKLRALNDGRFMYSNYGKGALGTYWNTDAMPALVQMVDVASDDLYFYSDPNLPVEAPNSEFWPVGATVRTSGSYGFTMDRMKSFLNQSQLHPTWNFIEDGHPWSEPDSEAPTMTPDHLEGATWMSIIHEARGILYFNHNFGGSCLSFHAIFDCQPAMKTRMDAVNAKIKSLAPVLNTQSYVYNFNNATNTMLKTYNGSAYIFAGIGQLQSSGSKTFTLPPDVNGTTVTVVGENRTIPVNNRSFSDSFAAEFSHHVYQISL